MRELDGFYFFCVLCFMINNMYFFLFLDIYIIQSEYVNKIGKNLSYICVINCVIIVGKIYGLVLFFCYVLYLYIYMNLLKKVIDF